MLQNRLSLAAFPAKGEKIPEKIPREYLRCYSGIIMRQRFLLLFAALLLGGASVQAQNLVLADDFNDNLVDPMWTVSFDPLQFWDVNEAFGTFNVNGLTAPFGAFDERYTLTADVPGTLPSGFQLDMAFAWNEQSGFNPGENAEVFVVRLYDASGIDIATFKMDDQSTTDAGDFLFEGSSAATVPAIPANSDATFSLIRDANDNLSYDLTVTNGPSSSGSLGTLNGTVAKVAFYVSHTSLCGPCGPFLGQLHVDDLKVYDGPINAGPNLHTPGLTAGAAAKFHITNATPFGTVFLAYSLAGGGPTSTAFGTASLSAPIKTIGSASADVSGDALFTMTVPSGGSGVTVWFQALDLTAGALSNGLMETVL